ncbi:MAG: alpha/beta hydrolase [Acidobacteria bacterium]|nr:alpha/beta hydrolase [Acidobacteriota bacterium]
MRRIRWLRVGLLALGALIACAGVACSLLGPDFSPAVATDSMRAEGLESRHVAWTPEGGDEETLHYVVAGSGGRRVLFVHGSPGTWEAYRGYLDDPRLRAVARLLAFDRPGFGDSGRGRTEPSLARQAAAAARVLDAEPGPPAVVVGHSLGGPIAARLAVDRPDLVGALVLVAPSLDPSLERHRWYNVAGSWRAVQLFLSVDMITSNRELWPLRAELEALEPRLREVRCPTIVIQGDEDELVPPANADFAARALPPGSVEVRRVPGEGHFVLWTRPEWTVAAIIESLSRPADALSGTGGE